MTHVRYDCQKVKDFCTDAFIRFGFSEEESRIITDVLVTSDLYGIESHGMQRISRYDKGIEKGMIKVHADFETVFETPVSAVIDAHQGMGQLSGYKGMKLAIDKAKKTGMAAVTVRNSNHYGIAGYYAMMAVKEGMIGFSCTNSEAIMVPTHAKKAMLGSNPIAFAAPADPYPFLFDASTTVVTRGKLEMYNKAEHPLPENWAEDADGVPCTDAGEVLSNIVNHNGGGILPLGGYDELSGGHKGYGYGMICEILSSILSMGLTSNHTHQNNVGGTCHCFIAIDPAVFGDPQEIREHFSTFLSELRKAPKAEAAERIYTHGEKEAEAVERIKRDGIPVDVKTAAEMKQMADYLGVDFESYFGMLPDTDSYESLY